MMRLYVDASFNIVHSARDAALWNFGIGLWQFISVGRHDYLWLERM